MSESDAREPDQGEAALPLDASLRVDTRALSSEEQDFARMMGFGDEADAATPSPAVAKKPAPKLPARAPVAKPPTPPSQAEPRLAESTDASSATAPLEETVPTAPAKVPETLPETPPARPRDWEEIHPRAATLGRQSALSERADRVPKLEPGPETSRPAKSESGLAGAGRPETDSSGLRESLTSSEARIAELEAIARDLSDALERKDRELATHARPSMSERPASPESEKQIDALTLEIDALVQERDRLGDALSAATTARAEAQSRAERLESALRATRSPSGPVPEGERDLRAEVIGLRRRLEESSAENRRLRETLEVQATDLAIAGAHRDDRQHEIDQLRERSESLERDRALQIERLDDALLRQRELLAVVTRVQAENTELRSTQAALEETLEARDLEIGAREEHLQVTRRGLAARDEQLVDASTRLEQARHRHELLESELGRARLAQVEIEERLLRREARIASLSTTLARIEEAIGRPLPRSSAPRAESHAEPRKIAEPGASRLAVQPLEPPVEAPPERANEATRMPAPVFAVPAARPTRFVTWRNEKLSELVGETTTAYRFLARRLVEHASDGAPMPLRITSLGGACPEAEVELARACTALGLQELSIRVVDPSPATAEARRRRIEEAGLSSSIRVEIWGVAEREPAATSSALLLCDALWGQPEPQAILDEVAQGLASDGLVLFADRIAGGPLSLSQTTLEKLAELWHVLPEAWTDRPAFASTPRAGEDGGAEGPQADLVAALFARFEPITTLGFGHVADLAVGPARGFVLSEPGIAAESFLTSIDAIDESQSIRESLPARHGVAVFRGRDEQAPGGLAAVEVLGLEWIRSSR